MDMYDNIRCWLRLYVDYAAGGDFFSLAPTITCLGCSQRVDLSAIIKHFSVLL